MASLSSLSVSLLRNKATTIPSIDRGGFCVVGLDLPSVLPLTLVDTHTQMHAHAMRYKHVSISITLTRIRIRIRISSVFTFVVSRFHVFTSQVRLEVVVAAKRPAVDHQRAWWLNLRLPAG